ncbi:hypothetical protein K505DRAFT_377584 [Melanomma pulvis-pyrius CBS 109.77]|uniref:RING-type domain-containing protein n=1 Tax=Melanomma pulvis-pyrius CBS 109.77 TaxID=1314802 RepID=A0A6A6X1W6_9PLEO|nr:hypothetical protein K505DRAFT_377584 [Melanomma pulvis-pyrius CBS 109.77]
MAPGEEHLPTRWLSPQSIAPTTGFRESHTMLEEQLNCVLDLSRKGNPARFQYHLKLFIAYYTRVVQTYPQECSTGLDFPSGHLIQIRNYHRRVVYDGSPAWEISDLGCDEQSAVLHLDSEQTQRARRLTAKRVLWLELRTRDSQPRYPIEEWFRRAPFSRQGDGRIASALSARSQWILDLTLIPSLEIQILMLLVSHVQEATAAFWEMVDGFPDAVRRVARETSSPGIPIRLFTRLWTRRAMASEDKTCCICFEPYAHPILSGGNREDAVRVSECGHVFGARCLQRIIDMGRTNCPYCNQSMLRFGRVGRKMENLEREIEGLDERVDRFFLEEGGWGKVYGEELGKLLKELKALFERVRVFCQEALDLHKRYSQA